MRASIGSDAAGDRDGATRAPQISTPAWMVANPEREEEAMVAIAAASRPPPLPMRSGRQNEPRSYGRRSTC
jgi:hypothetical protein